MFSLQLRSKQFRNIQEAVVTLQEMACDNEDPADIIIIPHDVDEVSDEGEGNDEAAKADIPQSFSRNVAGTIEIRATLAVPEADSYVLPIVIPTRNRKPWTTSKINTDQTPQ
ncbi:hypothetical protein QYM36_005120 [Artemia franciscana]|uniref:Uncharacterized protein n=1 Tax=Artemia franciscana TaxID=6661 RepID=A0AA88HWP8_ARTSF|nr:hypothetical protein QYM36_005120 [Artemia franciscana]